MALVVDNLEISPLTDDCSKKNIQESIDTLVLPSGERENVTNTEVSKTSGNDTIDTEPCERKKKTRRGKPKRKNPYNKEGNESRKVANRTKKVLPCFVHRHADAPYNTNEFLMEDHADHGAFVKALVEPSAIQKGSDNPRPPRVRDPSFTSVESDEDYFYSSPEDEQEYLTKEFSNTYEELHVETLHNLTKYELIDQVLQLEEKIDGLEKRLESRENIDKEQSENLKNALENLAGQGDNISLETMKQFQIEIGRLRLENEKLQVENERLRRRNRSSSVSSVDSESDSTTSSPSSVSSLSDKEALIESNTNDEDMDDYTGKCDEQPDGENPDVTMNDKNMLA